jgi:galactoside O-acetyltransferase
MSIAKTAVIHDPSVIIHRDSRFSMDEFSQIDAFVFINAGQKCTIGKFVHISSFVSIIGGGIFEMGNFSGLSAGCRIITGSDDFSGPFMTNPTIPGEFSNVSTSRVAIGRHAIVGTNSIIFPGVTLGDGVAIGAGSIVRTDLKAWGIYAGSGTLRKIGERDREEIVNKERLLLKKCKLDQ